MKKTFLKRRIINLLLLLVLLTPFVSCKDNDEDIITYYDTYVEGYITDFHTGQPIAGVVFDAKYFDESNGSFGTDPYFVENIAVSNSEGYYKIKIPKHGELGSREMSVDFYSIRVFPRATSDYSFEFGTFNYKSDSVNIISKRVDIRPITYGYLKVILPKTSSDNWGIWGYFASTYENPFYQHRLISNGDYNDTFKYFLFKVAATNMIINCGNTTQNFHFTINNPKDTVILNIEQ